jgi:hypothetical protein
MLVEIITGEERYNSAFPPDLKPVGEGETVLGVLPEPLRALFTIVRGYGEQVDRLAEQDVSENEPHYRDYMEVRGKTMTRANILNELFWSCTLSTFKAWHLNLGIRAGWQVVEKPKAEAPLGLGWVAILSFPGEAPPESDTAD